MSDTSWVAVRCYVPPPASENDDDRKPKTRTGDRTGHSSSLVLVLDTETTVDKYQNLLFGSCGVWANGYQDSFYLFYNDEQVTKDQENIIRAYAEEHGYSMLTRTEFVEKIFFPLVFEEGAKCVGFNLPFDLSRLAVRCSESRGNKGGFSLVLSEDRRWPRIAIKSIDSKRAFIRFMMTFRKPSDKKYRFNRGYFLDLKTMTFALTNNSYSLAKAAEDFGCTLRKIPQEEHGNITAEYVDYNVNDVLTTYELYTKAVERYKLFCLGTEPSRLYSPASLGKAYLEKMGVRPFLEKNPEFPSGVLGHLMMAYYGGRCEVRVRCTPTKVAYLDFTSMYPTMYTLQFMDMYLKADKINYTVCTEDTQHLLDMIKLEDIGRREIWPAFTAVCRIKPDQDILPVRAQYGDDGAHTIGLNYLSSEGPSMWYTLADLVASKLLTGKTPHIEEAIRFTPGEMQSDLNYIEILPGVTVKPGEDFIKRLIEERLRFKKQMKQAAGEERHQLDLKQNILKIVANSTSYGIYIEVNTRPADDTPVTVYGLDSFETTVSKLESEGKAFNPIMAVFITAGARLILVAAEALITRAGGDLVYCDTDSIFISPEHVGLVQDFFRKLNPYDVPMEMFKVEPDDQDKPLDDVWFYGISAKRYVLYDRDRLTGKITIRKHSSHGLGGLMNFD